MSIKALDKLGDAIVDAGYDWTYDMRKAYEDGIKQSQWKGLTEDEAADLWADAHDIHGKMIWSPLKLFEEIDRLLREKNT